MAPDIAIRTPDAQYADDGVIERAETGPAATWRIFCERSGDALPDDALRAADAVATWHVMPIDRAFIARLDRCRIIVRAGVGFDHIDLEAAFPSATCRITGSARWRTMSSASC